MQNRVDKTLSPSEITDIKNSIKAVYDKINPEKGLTLNERKKGGWFLSPRALQMLEKSLVLGKSKPGSFPHVDLAAFERDINLINQLKSLESQLAVLQAVVEDTRRLLTKDSSEQGFYIYNTLKTMYGAGIPDGVMYEQLKSFMPRTGKKLNPKTEE